MPRGPRTAVFGVLTLLVGAVLALIVPTAAQAGPYPPSTCARLAVSTTTPQPGESITVTGRNFHAGDTEKIVLRPGPVTLATVTVRANGTFSTQVTIPSNVSGQHSIGVVGPKQSCPVGPIRIVVQGAPPVPTGSSPGGNGGGGGHIPGNTGLDVLVLLAIAAVLIIAGVGLTRSGRTRRARRVWTP